MSGFNIRVINIINIICIVTIFFLRWDYGAVGDFCMFDNLCNSRDGHPCKGHTWPANPWFWCNGWMDVHLRNEHILASRSNIF